MSQKKQKNVPFSSAETILESISDGVFTVDRQWKITSFNRAAETITGIGRDEAIGRHCSDVFRASMCEADCALRRTFETGESVVNRSAFIINAQGQQIPISVSTALLRNEKGEVIGGAETFRDLTLVEELRKELEGRYQLGDMVSRSPLMHRLFDVLPLIAASDSSVLIEGETGTGKELLARAVHFLSSRKNGPFVAVNCGALPDTLLESELFGYKAGAFTGAERDKAGRFALAEGGTLFLDEIGDISPAMQVRLLRVLQEREYEPLGATSPEKTNVRVIAASNKPLETLVKDGLFRMDLFYRINVVRLELPPLRDRKEDIPLLVDALLARMNRHQSRGVNGVTPEAMAVLMAHDYPGNIRELENILERAFILCPPDRYIAPACLPENLAWQTASKNYNDPLKTVVQATEARAIAESMERNKGDRDAVARELGMHRSTLFRRIKSLGLRFPKPKRR